jgi:mitogen-activated protein kinase 1/3
MLILLLLLFLYFYYRYHTFKASGQQFEVPSRYQLIRPVGHGAYGIVVSVNDTVTGKQMAIKKIRSAFDDRIDAKRILREIKLLKKLEHENVIKINDLIPPPPGAEEFEDVYIVQELMETDLHRIIHSRQPLTIDHIQYFIYQILRGLKFIHSANVLHRDLKPSNLLLNSNCDLKICDFGLARGVEDEQAGILTEYVVTRWYRAPEIMLVCQEYTKAIDVWSVGCIFAELLARAPLFPGEDYIAQLRLICGKLGRPDDDDLDFVTSERAKRFIVSLPSKPSNGQTLKDSFPNFKNETDALDLLEKMLEFHPDRRITIEKALQHPFLNALHNSDDEPISDFTFSFDFENDDLSREQVQELIWKEVKEMHPYIPTNPPNSSTPRVKAKQMLDSRADAKEGGGSSNSNSSNNNNNNSSSSSSSSSDGPKSGRKRSISPGSQSKDTSSPTVGSSQSK